MNKAILIYLRIAILSGIVQINGILQTAEPPPLKKARGAPVAPGLADWEEPQETTQDRIVLSSKERAIADAVFAAITCFSKPLTHIMGQFAIYFTPEDIEAANKLLLEGIKENNTNKVKQALENGAIIDGNDDSFRPLIIASNWNHPKIVKILVDARAQVDIKTSNGATALNCVSNDWGEAGAREIMGILLDARADANYKCENQKSFSDYVEEGNQVHEKIHQDHLARKKAAQEARLAYTIAF